VKCPFFRRGMVRVHVGGDMNYYGATVQEWRMKVQEVILRAMAKKITWWQAAEILGISDRQMRRWKHRYDDYMAMTGSMTGGEVSPVRGACLSRGWRKSWGCTGQSTSI